MKQAVWKNAAGRDRLNEWYDRFLKKIEHPVESAFISTSRGPCHVLIGGPKDAPPLICLHAMRTGSAFLLSELGPILEKFRVYAPDLPGQSIKGPEIRFPLDDDSLALWLAEILDGLGLDQVNLLGVSWGGFLARLTATSFPDRIRSLTMVVPAGIANGSHWKGLAKMAFPMMRYRFNPSNTNLRKLLSPILTTWDDDWAGFIACTIRDMKMDFRIPPLANDQELQGLTMPTLVLAADQDISFPGHLITRRLADLVTNVDVEIIHNCKHCPPTTPEFRDWLCSRLILLIK